MELQGKTALVTGAARRLGRAISLILASEGMHLLLHYHTSSAQVRETQKTAERLGVGVRLIQADLSQFSGISSLVREAYHKAPSRLSVLINNASVFYKTPFGRVREKDWDEILAVNLKAPFFLAQSVGHKMFRAKEGKIINLADWTAFRPYSRYLPYCISKAGLVSLTQGLAKILAPYVQVNAVAPGPILPAKGVSAEENRRIARRTPLGRFGEPSDIAEAVRFLVRSTDFVTGAVLPVDGGNLIA